MAEGTGSRSYDSISSLGRDSMGLPSISQTSFVHVDERFLCPVCQSILRDAVQTSCGHRMCEGCSAALFEGGSPVKCPASDKEDPVEPIYKEQVFRDASARREIAQLPVFCSNASLGCTDTVSWKSLTGYKDFSASAVKAYHNKQVAAIHRHARPRQNMQIKQPRK